MSRSLNVFLYGKHVGVLTEGEIGRLSFEYNADTYPLSVRMPVRAEPYDAAFTEPFFENLTPEGDVLELLAQKYRMSRKNSFSVLSLIGGECAGAVSLYPGDPVAQIDEPLRELTPHDIARIIDALPANPLLTGLDCAPRLSLAGAQSKFAVRKSADGRYYRSDDMNPTTHIIKIANKRFEGLLENEFFCMLLSRSIFTDAVEVQMHEAEGRKYLEIERYDRRLVGEKIERIHQEDFCQVLGYLSQKKYQSDDGPSIRQIYRALKQYSHRKAADSYKFIRLLIFNYLIGNTDAHAKNFSVVHTNRNNSVILSPAYDLVSIDIYSSKDVSHEIALLVNGKAKYSALRRKDWLALFDQLELNSSLMMKEMEKSFARIVEKARQLADQLNDAPLTASGVYEKIMNNIRSRSEILFG